MNIMDYAMIILFFIFLVYNLIIFYDNNFAVRNKMSDEELMDNYVRTLKRKKKQQ